MEDLFGINAHRQAVQENIEKAFDLGFDADNNIEGIEKAKHQVGDIHPNGRWVWTEWAPGKFDWKSLKGKHHKGSQQTTTQQQITDDKEVASFMDKIKIFSNKYNDPSKVSVSKTPKGNWDVSYDGHRLGIINADQLSEKVAKNQGWLKEESKKDEQPTEVEIDNDEYKKQYDIALKQLMSGSDEDKHAVNFGISVVRSNISNTKKELRELKETRPGAKKAIQKLESDLVKFYSQEKAFNDALKTASGTKKEENKSEKLSAFVDKTLKDIKDYAYGNFDDDRLKKAEKVLTENESLAKKFMSATFPAASESALSPSEKEISISDDESIILSAYKTTDTTSRNPAYRGSTDYHYAVYHKVGYSKKLLDSGSYSRVFSAKYGGTSSDRKNKCKINALIKYFHI